MPVPAKSRWYRAAAGPLSNELEGEPEPSLDDVLKKLSPVIVIVEGFKRHSHPKLEVYRAAVGKPLLHPDDDCIVARATDASWPQARRCGDARRHRDHRQSCRPSATARADRAKADAGAVDTRSAAERRLMAQLTDDCFAFNGPFPAGGRGRAVDSCPR